MLTIRFIQAQLAPALDSHDPSPKNINRHRRRGMLDDLTVFTIRFSPENRSLGLWQCGG
ncbi:hypothetical protein SAY87_003775 [Trapa incisa]|uniref:Uncharacterized protein n=1 Tax=Trapa incisa TaxID=236973 RepID=A0AAN7QID7_9MYRT|nr:hypothetical protein SAY87_003775 [Trapa incisa]